MLDLAQLLTIVSNNDLHTLGKFILEYHLL